MYSDDSEITTSAVSDADLAAMTADLADGIRCEAAITDADLIEMERESRITVRPAPEYRAIDDHQHDAIGQIDPNDCEAFAAFQVGRLTRPLKVDDAGRVFVPFYVCDGEAEALGMLIAEFNIGKRAPAAESRVAVHGRFFKASARVAGGKWVNAGTFADENAAQAAASAKAKELAAGTRTGGVIMYEVAEHRFGRATVKSGPMSGCRGFEEHKWTGIAVVRSKAVAVELANASPIHATVVKRFTADVIYDNGKPPGERA